MNTTFTIWRAELMSLRNAARHDVRMRVALFVGLVFDLVAGFWSGGQALAHLQQWRTAGALTLTAGLWSLCWLTWSGMGIFTIIGLPRALSGQEDLLLFALPLTPATRFRALSGSFFLKNLWNWLLLQVAIMGYVLLSVLGWGALAWLVLLQLGVVLSVCCTLLAGLLVMRYLIPRGQITARIFTALALGLLVILIAIFAGRLAALERVLLLWLRPEFVAVLLLGLLCMMVGPLAAVFGRLYVAAFQATQSNDRLRTALSIPGVRAFTRLFERRRSLTGALFARAVAGQSRNLLFWLRMAMILALLALFPLLRSFATRYGFSDGVLIAACAAGLAVFHIIETGPCAISGEASRLALYLTAPFTFARIMRAKLTLFLLPVLIEGMTIGLFFCWQLHLMPAQVAPVMIAIVLMGVGCTALLVWGSAWDGDLDFVVEGALATFMQEEAPVTPRRMALSNGCVLLFAVMCLLLWKLPIGAALAMLALLDIAMLVGMWRLGLSQMRALLRKG
jgi:hypothetical protein